MSAASDQKLFCELCSPFCCSFNEFVEEKVYTPSYSSAILTLTGSFLYFLVPCLNSHCVHLFFSQVQVSSVQPLSCIRLFVTPWTATHQASLSTAISQSVPKLISIESLMPSNHLMLCRPYLLSSIFPSITVFSNESALHIRLPNYWSFSFSISPSNEYSRLISLRMDWLYLLAIQGTNTTVQKYQFFGTQLSL